MSVLVPSVENLYVGAGAAKNRHATWYTSHRHRHRHRDVPPTTAIGERDRVCARDSDIH